RIRRDTCDVGTRPCWREEQDAAGARLGYEHLASAPHCETAAAAPDRANGCGCSDDACGHLSDTTSSFFEDEHLSAVGGGNLQWSHDEGARSRPAIAQTLRTTARKTRNRPSGRYNPYAIIIRVAHIQVSRSIHGEAGG